MPENPGPGPDYQGAAPMSANGSSRQRTYTPKYRLHKPRNRAVVTIDGRDFYLGPYGSPESKAEYDRLIGLWLANGRRLPEEDPEDLTIDEVIVAFWRHATVYYVKNGEPTSEQETVRAALKVLRRLYGPTYAKDFGPLALNELPAEGFAADFETLHPVLDAVLRAELDDNEAHERAAADPRLRRHAETFRV
jgi:hypothetical protein